MKRHLLVAAAFGFAFAAAGCVSDEETGANPTRDASFLGYSSPETKQTTCGNCHPSEQAKWAETKHATAWADLQASGHAEPTCSRCHTVNGLTNGVGDSTGFFAVSTDARQFYRDVQCESCHGPGAAHARAPDETQPIPTMLVDSTYADGCASCHNSSNHPFEEQLAASKHGMMPNWEGTSGSCQVNCHNGFGAMIQIAPRARFRESVTTVSLTSNPSLTCAVCHEPHDATNNPAQIRLSLSTMDTAQHMCGKCHNRSPNATLTSSRGPHSAQAAVVFGTAGWVPASFGNISGPARHGTQEGSCATCHMSAGPVNNASGTFVVQNVGHTFSVLPCLNAAAAATGGVDTSAACTDALRDFSACATSNCHGSVESARHAMELLQGEIMSYVSVLWVDMNHNDTLEAAPVDSGWIPKLLQHDATRTGTNKRFSTTDAVITPAEGARFNALLAASPNQHGDGSKGVHNPGYMRALMQQTIALMRTTYATSDTLAGVPPAVQAHMRRAGTR